MQAGSSLLTRLLPERARGWLVSTFFGLLLLGGWRMAADYGSYIDESTCRDSGQVSLVYAYTWVPPALLPARAATRWAAMPTAYRLPTYKDRAYGVGFELPMTLIEKLSGYTALADVLVLRHRCVFLVCFAGLLAFYWLVTQRLGSWRAGLLGALLLVLSPRQFADAFYNAKDAVFLGCFLLATATTVAFLRRPTLGRALGHALACALAIDVRVMGVLLPALTGGLVVLRTLHGDYRGQRTGGAVLAYALLLVALVVAMWPYLWPAPAAHFYEALTSMSRYDWVGKVLFRGRWLPSNAPLPWTYAPVWIGITTPLLYLVGLGLALLLLLRQLVRRGWRLYATAGEWQDLLFWSLALAPLGAVMVLHSVLYNGWRHLYFVYPPLLLLAVRGLVAAWRWPWARLAWPLGWPALAGTAALVSVGTVANAMRQLHPLENLYFNALAGTHPEQRYDYDYWGLSVRQALAWIAAHDARPAVQVYTTDLYFTGLLSVQLLPAPARQRLSIMPSPGQADYIVAVAPAVAPAGGAAQPVYTLALGPEHRRVFTVYRRAATLP